MYRMNSNTKIQPINNKMTKMPLPYALPRAHPIDSYTVTPLLYNPTYKITYKKIVSKTHSVSK